MHKCRERSLEIKGCPKIKTNDCKIDDAALSIERQIKNKEMRLKRVKHMHQVDFYQKQTLPNNNDGNLTLRIVFFLKYIPFSIVFSEKWFFALRAVFIECKFLSIYSQMTKFIHHLNH